MPAAVLGCDVPVSDSWHPAEKEIARMEAAVARAAERRGVRLTNRREMTRDLPGIGRVFTIEYDYEAA